MMDKKLRIEKLQKRLELCVLRQRNYFKRYGEPSEKIDHEEIKYIGIINQLRAGMGA